MLDSRLVNAVVVPSIFGLMNWRVTTLPLFAATNEVRSNVYVVPPSGTELLRSCVPELVKLDLFRPGAFDHVMADSVQLVSDT